MAVGLILSSFGRALSQLGHRPFRRVFFVGILLALVLLIGATAGFAWLVDYITPENAWLPVLGEVRWLDDLFSWGALALLLVLSVFLTPSLKFSPTLIHRKRQYQPHWNSWMSQD